MWKLLLSALVVVSTVAAPTKQDGVVHEKRGSGHTRQYVRTGPVERDGIIPVRIGLVQSNTDKAYDHLLDISHPTSANYGKHWTSAEVEAEFAPSPESLALVQEWLASAGIRDARETRRKGWIVFEAPVDQIERLFETELYEYKHSVDGTFRVGSDQYSLPEHIAAHIDYITPGVQLSAPLKKRKVKISKRWNWPRPHGPPPPEWGPVSPPSDLAKNYWPHWKNTTGQASQDVSKCGQEITPPCLRALYNIPMPETVLDPGILGILEYHDVYSQEDLNEYFAHFTPEVPKGTHPKLVSINGAQAPVAQNSSLNTGESNIDFTIAYSLLGNVPITLYQQNDPRKEQTDSFYHGESFLNDILDAVDPSYCDSEDLKDGFECGGNGNLTTVLSVSYGGAEVTGFRAENRACNEMAKLALQGHTILIASGDYGVANDAAPSCDSNQCYSRDFAAPNGPVFNTASPATCPFVLTVGATQLNSNSTVHDSETSLLQPGSSGCKSKPNLTPFSSSGGFSNYFRQPSYQTAAVEAYFASHDPGYATYSISGRTADHTTIPVGARYNRIGRAYPDVSANGYAIIDYQNGVRSGQMGTSLSTPIWASLIAMINQKRSESGKRPVGFVNPVLYQHPEIFNDITVGRNPGCGSQGFEAVEGWDPVTGLGTPKYDVLEKVFLDLP